MARRKQGDPAESSEEVIQKRSAPTVHIQQQKPSEKVSAFAIRTEYFEGPLPDPETLAKYEDICTGAASRILAMAEAQSQHRQDLERQVVASNCRSQDRGPIFGFLIAALVVAIGGYLLYQGRELSGLTALIVALASIVIPFVVGKAARQKELEKKNEDLVSDEDENGRPWDYTLPPARPANKTGASS